MCFCDACASVCVCACVCMCVCGCACLGACLCVCACTSARACGVFVNVWRMWAYVVICCFGVAPCAYLPLLFNCCARYVFVVFRMFIACVCVCVCVRVRVCVCVGGGGGVGEGRVCLCLCLGLCVFVRLCATVICVRVDALKGQLCLFVCCTCMCVGGRARLFCFVCGIVDHLLCLCVVCVACWLRSCFGNPGSQQLVYAIVARIPLWVHGSWPARA